MQENKTQVYSPKTNQNFFSFHSSIREEIKGSQLQKYLEMVGKDKLFLTASQLQISRL